MEESSLAQSTRWPEFCKEGAPTFVERFPQRLLFLPFFCCCGSLWCPVCALYFPSLWHVYHSQRIRMRAWLSTKKCSMFSCMLEMSLNKLVSPLYCRALWPWKNVERKWHYDKFYTSQRSRRFHVSCCQNPVQIWLDLHWLPWISMRHCEITPILVCARGSMLEFWKDLLKWEDELQSFGFVKFSKILRWKIQRKTKSKIMQLCSYIQERIFK